MNVKCQDMIASIYTTVMKILMMGTEIIVADC